MKDLFFFLALIVLAGLIMLAGFTSDGLSDVEAGPGKKGYIQAGPEVVPGRGAPGSGTHVVPHPVHPPEADRISWHTGRRSSADDVAPFIAGD